MKNFLKKLDITRIFLLLCLLFLLILIIITSKGAQKIIFMSSFIILNLFITLYKRYFRLPIEIEILSLGIILCSVSYDVAAGLFVALIGGILYTVFNTNFSPFTIPMILGYMMMAFLSSFFSHINIVYLGIFVNIIHNIFVFTIYHFLFKYDLSKNLLFSISNVLFNILLFINLGGIMYGVMT